MEVGRRKRPVGRVDVIVGTVEAEARRLRRIVRVRSGCAAELAVSTCPAPSSTATRQPGRPGRCSEQQAPNRAPARTEAEAPVQPSQSEYGHGSATYRRSLSSLILFLAVATSLCWSQSRPGGLPIQLIPRHHLSRERSSGSAHTSTFLPRPAPCRRRHRNSQDRMDRRYQWLKAIG
jgi:hypothetical protein